jgi:ubiquinone/menaquinone biosynthesis C-methylase UbiE
MTNIHRVNYDQIAHLYDEPGRNYGPDPYLSKFLEERTDLSHESIHVLDMGCGTGKQLTANKKKYPKIKMVGLDLFQGMLNQAKKRSQDITWIQGDSTNTLLDSNSFDFISNQFSYHHIQDKNKLFTETFRILKPKGRFVITNLNPWSMPNWVVYQFFPAARDRDFRDFLPIEALTSLLNSVGFINVQVKFQLKEENVNLSEFMGYAGQRHRTSQLICIQDEEYKNGIIELAKMIKDFGVDHCVTSQMCLVWITADKPGGIT